MFNFRAEIITHDGKKCYMTLNSYEQFLAKLDMVQREMGNIRTILCPSSIRIDKTRASERPL